MTFRRSLVWLALLLVASSTPAQEVAWRKDYATAIKEAREKGKPLFLTFTMIGCRWCHTLDASTYRDPAVARALEEQFVPFKVQAEDYPELVRFLGIQSFPTMVVASPEGRIIEVHKGYLEAGPMGAMLNRAIAKLHASPTAPAVAAAPPAPKPEDKAPAVTTAAPKEPVPAKTAASVKEVPTPEPPIASADPVLSPPAPPIPGMPAERGLEPAWMAETFKKANDAVGRSEYSKAIPLIRQLVQEDAHWPTQARAVSLYRDIERKATEQLTKVKEAEVNNHITDAIALARELVAQFDGTETAAETLTLLSSLNSRVDEKDRERMKTAGLMLVMAKADFRANQYLPCLLRCEEILAHYADLHEASEAGELAEQIKNNPERLQLICDNLPEVLGQIYLMTAEMKLKQSEPQQAVFFLERVMQAFPHSRHAEMAQVRLSQLQGPPAVGAAGEDKKP
jgi:hypothetical protein